MSDESALNRCQELIQDGMANEDVHLAQFHLLLRLQRPQEAVANLSHYLKGSRLQRTMLTLCDYLDGEGRHEESRQCRSWLLLPGGSTQT